MLLHSRNLTEEELVEVSGGIKWDRGHHSPNVIDMRGGQKRVGLWTIATYDINGNLSSTEYVSPW